MFKALSQSHPFRADRALGLLRLAVAGILLVHPIHRLVHGNVPGFGGWLASQGIPFGTAVAFGLTACELLSGLALLARRLVIPACVFLICVLLAGIWMVHGPEGWFVVGGGHNGVEFSVLLIAGLTALGWAHWPQGRSSGPS